MSAWRDIVARLQAGNEPVVLVSVDSIVGSTPREPGAKMLVTEDDFYGTIGGGNLEFQALDIARNLLRTGSEGGLRRFPLGAGLGQCCGGLVNLMFELLDETSDWSRADMVEDRIELTLFGAGHVGTALVRALAGLPVAIRWVDSRDGMLPVDPPAGVECIETDIPETEVDAAPAGSYFLVMTHDHALDQKLCEQILGRDDFAYFGLIGSAAKRRNFETRLARRGVDPARFANMTCPIGVGGISGKQPAQIAISVAAQILQVYDRRHNQNQSGDTALRQMGTES